MYVRGAKKQRKEEWEEMYLPGCKGTKEWQCWQSEIRPYPVALHEIDGNVVKLKLQGNDNENGH